MQITQKQLQSHLSNALTSLYFLSGDEHLLLEDARNIIIKTAKKQGFSEHQRIYCDNTHFTEALTLAFQNQDLFSTKKIIDIRNPKAKFDGKILSLIETPVKEKNSDFVVIISTEKLSPAQQKTNWYQSFKKNAVVVPIWPIESAALPQWIVERAQERFKLKIAFDAAREIAFFSEGNLLSAEQVLMKLHLLYEKTDISREQLIHVLSDQAQFTVFDLSHALARKNPKKAIRILKQLEKTGEEPVLVLWSITRDYRARNIFAGLTFAGQVDEILKGARPGNPWEALEKLILLGCGYDIA